jgi:hypothetical protein
MMQETTSLGYEPCSVTQEQLELMCTLLAAEQASSEPRERSKGGFLSRQFAPVATRGQKKFDALFGIVLPALCLFFDPIVFRGGMMGTGGPVLGQYRLFAYGVIAIEIGVLALWLLAGERLKDWGGMLGGAMLAGALFSLAVGMLILPYTIIGLIILVGVFGFIPFFTTFVYLRNAARALATSEPYLGAWRRAAALALGATVSLAAPAYAHLRIERAVARALPALTSEDDAQAARAARHLRLAGWLGATDFDEIARAYENEPDATRRERLAHSYRALTGRDIEARLRVIHD